MLDKAVVVALSGQLARRWRALLAPAIAFIASDSPASVCASWRGIVRGLEQLEHQARASVAAGISSAMSPMAHSADADFCDGPRTTQWGPRCVALAGAAASCPRPKGGAVHIAVPCCRACATLRAGKFGGEHLNGAPNARAVHPVHGGGRAAVILYRAVELLAKRGARLDFASRSG